MIYIYISMLVQSMVHEWWWSDGEVMVSAVMYTSLSVSKVAFSHLIIQSVDPPPPFFWPSIQPICFVNPPTPPFPRKKCATPPPPQKMPPSHYFFVVVLASKTNKKIGSPPKNSILKNLRFFYGIGVTIRIGQGRFNVSRMRFFVFLSFFPFIEF